MDSNVTRTSKGERIGYYSYFTGQNMIYIFVTLYLSLYFTTVLGIPAGTVGLIFLIARVWDAVNDPLLSVFIEKVRFKSGKFKPWIKSVTILIPILTILNFSFSGVLQGSSQGIRTAYALIVYIAWGMVYTISDAPAYALATVMTDVSNEKNRLITFSKLSGMLGLLVSMVVAPILVDRLNGNWMLVAVIISVIAFGFLVWINGAKERITSDAHTPSLGDILRVIFKNKYLLIIVLTIVVMNGFNFSMTITPFLADYIYEDPSLTSIIMGLSVLPIVIVSPMIPRLVERFGKNKLMVFALASTLVLSLVTLLIARESFVLFLLLSILKFLLSGPMLIITALYFSDIIDYEFYTSGKRLEAVTFSIQTFSNKLVSAIAGAVPMFILGLIGFVESTGDELVVQTPEVINGIWVIYHGGPAVGALISLVIFLKYYKLDEKKLEAMKSKVELS